MKYCILKGIEGFGDRLQCLLQAIEYCEKTNRCLVVDWRDPHWSQNQEESIEHYFSIKNIKTKTLHEFLKNQKQNSNIIPETWKDKIEQSNFHKFIYQKKYRIENNKIFAEICRQEKKDFQEEIVVYPSVLNRSFKDKYFLYISLSQLVEDRMKEKFTNYNLKRRDYNCIHIRAQNKKWTNGVVNLKSLKRNINTKFPKRELYFRYLQLKYLNLNQNTKTVIISDNEEDSIYFNKNYCNNKCVVIEANTMDIGKLCGTHKKILEGHKVKTKMNVETLVDFHIMLNCKHLIKDDMSLFSNMAQNIRAHIE